MAAENAVLRARVAKLDAQVTALSEQVATLAWLAFGRSSEKQRPGKRDPKDKTPGSAGAAMSED